MPVMAGIACARFMYGYANDVMPENNSAVSR